MYSLIFDKKALEQLNKLDSDVKNRIWNKLQACKENPFHFLEPLVEINGFKLRIGDYRVIVEVDNSLKIIWVLKVGHRKNVYEN